MTPSKLAYSHTVKDKVYYVMRVYEKQKPEEWSFNRFLRVYLSEWAGIQLPKAFDTTEGVETIARRHREILELSRCLKR